MKIIIIGAGFTGGLLAKALVAEHNNVVLIDSNSDKVRSAGDQLDCTVIEANGSNLETLEKAGLSSADALVALTGEDEANMMICTLVDAVYPNILKIARVRDYDRYVRTMDVARRASACAAPNDRPTFGIDHIVNPDVEVAASIVRAMEIGAAGSSTEIGEGYAIVELPLAEGCPMAGRKLRSMPELEGWNSLIAFVETDGVASLPNGETELKSGDRVGVLSRRDEISKLLKFTGADSTRLDQVTIFGADNIGALTVAAHMDSSQPLWHSLLKFARFKRRRLMVIDRDSGRCRALADKFPEARILNGDITDDGLLQGEGVCESDLMVAASGNFERNLMTAAYLKLRGVKRVIALTSDSAFDEIAEKLGVDVTIPMRDIVIDEIMSHLRGRNVKEVHSVNARQFEIVSCCVAPKSKAVGKALREIEGLEGALVLLVKQPGAKAFEIPNGATVMTEGSHVAVIMPAGDTKTMQLFAGKLEMDA